MLSLYIERCVSVSELQVTPSQPDPDAILKSLKAQFDALTVERKHLDVAALSTDLIKRLPDFSPIWLEYGRALLGLGIYDEAMVCFRHAATINPHRVIPPFLLGHCLLEKHKGFNKATKGFIDTIDLWIPEFDGVFIMEIFHLGLDLFDLGFYQEALDCFDKINMDQPGLSQGILTASHCLLCLGRLAEGGARIRSWFEISVRRKEKTAIWAGEDLTGKTLFLIADGGIGDIVNFIRYVPQLAESCGQLLLFLSPNFQKMIGPIPNVTIVNGWPETYDYMTALLIVPHILGVDINAIPQGIPYLKPDPQLVEYWKKQIPQGSFRVGIVWQGSGFDSGRDIPLKCYAPLSQIPGVTLVSLQVRDGLDQLEPMPEGLSLHRFGTDFNAGPDYFVDTIAVVSQLDLIVTIDTSVAHVAGALGCPVWMVLKTTADWRWFKDREDCPWYPTMRLFRQRTKGDWDEVISRVKDALIEVNR